MKIASLIIIMSCIFACSRSQPDSITGWLSVGSRYGIESIYPDDRKQIVAIISTLTNDPIIEVLVVETDTIEVSTGVVRGPLDGGGKIFTLKIVNGKWNVYDDGSIKFWIS